MPKAISTATAHFSKLQRAHVNFVRALSVLQPSRIIGEADAADIEARAEYLREIFVAAVAYEEAIIADTVEHLPARIGRDREQVVNHLWDALSEDGWDVVGELAQRGVHFDTYGSKAA